MEIKTAEKFDVVPTRLAVQAMRDNGYKNAAYAIAELIDNSIQAGATFVELLCAEEVEQLAARRRRRIARVAVLDNGSGMNPEDLRKALQFGNGTRLDDRSGIGRFGMGLPSSSISQCRRVEVWSWQAGPDKACFSYLDLGEIERGEMGEVPEPIPSPVPEFWRDAGESFGQTGTLVVWSVMDRCIWKTASAIIRNSEYIIGRMYRRFIHDGRVVIRMAAVDLNNPKDVEAREAIVNDPGYLMIPCSCPEPFADKPMFQPFGERWEVPHQIAYSGEKHTVWIRFTIAREDAREEDQSGSKPHGRHAKHNIGVSIVRAGRELELSQSWVIKDPRERWWGVEIEFPPALDEVFGVSNNKQSARYLADAGTIDIEELLEGRTVHELKEEMLEEGDPLGSLIDIAARIKETLNQVRSLLKNQSRGLRKGRRKRYLDPESPESKGTRVTRKRQEEGFRGQSDDDEELPPDIRTKDIEEFLVDQGQTEEVANELAAATVSSGLKYIFTQADLEVQAFFSVRIKAGTIIITLNTRHPAYSRLVEVLECEDDTVPSEELRAKLDNASSGLRLLLGAWARLEDELPEGPRRENVMDIRADWGRVARQFLSED